MSYRGIKVNSTSGLEKILVVETMIRLKWFQLGTLTCSRTNVSFFKSFQPYLLWFVYVAILYYFVFPDFRVFYVFLFVNTCWFLTFELCFQILSSLINCLICILISMANFINISFAFLIRWILDKFRVVFPFFILLQL